MRIVDGGYFRGIGQETLEKRPVAFVGDHLGQLEVAARPGQAGFPQQVGLPIRERF
jgi:hypothetical protein